MTRVRSNSNSRCGDLVRYMLSAASPSSTFSDKFCGFDGEPYNEDVNNIFLDFENCLPSDAERYLFQVLERILEEAMRVEADLQTYGDGASAHVRRALQNQSDEVIQREVFEVVSAFTARTKAYYALAQQIEQALPNLLWELCSGPLPPAEQIDSAQALCKQLARIVDFVFRFDCLKMCTPALQNDFSFYKRALSRNTVEYHDKLNELACSISLFLANATPMLNSLSKATVAFVKEHPDLPVANTTETLSTIVYICRHMLERKDFCEKISPDTRNFVLRVMVGSLILFDHIDSEGAFARHSNIDLRSIVELIKANGNEQQVEQLMNAIRYTSKHFNDQDIPKSIRSLFAAN